MFSMIAAAAMKIGAFVAISKLKRGRTIDFEITDNK
jgi:hypothetical protein